MGFYRFDVANKAGSCHYLSPCPAVLGSNPQVPGAACHGVAGDPFVSRQQLRVEELRNGRIRVENLDLKVAMTLHDGAVVAPGGSLEVGLPMRVSVGETRIDIDAVDNFNPVEAPTLVTLQLDRSLFATATLAELGPTPSPERLAHWFERVIGVLRHAASSTDLFHRETARAVVELVGLDVGLILARKGTEWDVVAAYPEPEGPAANASFSRAVLEEVERTGATVYDPGMVSRPTASLQHLGAVVAAPWVDPRDGSVVGVVYGARMRPTGGGQVAVSPLEAQVVQVLAAADAAGRARQIWQERFAQFTAPELARTLDQDPAALDVGTRQVTILSADLRGSARLAGRLGKRYFDLSRNIMEQLTGRIAEHGGMVVDYAGDGILAMWNAPVLLPDHAEKACLAALAMHAEMSGLNRRWAETLGAPLELGIGIHSGTAMIGNAGSRWKAKYGPIGDPVNLSSRIEGVTKHLGVPVIISEATQQAVRGGSRSGGFARPVWPA